MTASVLMPLEDEKGVYAYEGRSVSRRDFKVTAEFWLQGEAPVRSDGSRPGAWFFIVRYEIGYSASSFLTYDSEDDAVSIGLAFALRLASYRPAGRASVYEIEEVVARDYLTFKRGGL